MSRPEVDRVTTAVAQHGEGPLWDATSRRLIWMDMLAGAVLATEPGGSTARLELDDPVAAFARPVHGSPDFVVVGERTVWRVDLADPNAVPSRVSDVPLPPRVRANDGGCSPSGTLHIGVMHYDAVAGAGQVLALDESGPRQVLGPTTIANGQQFISKDSVVFVDSADARICQYSVAGDGAWKDPIVIATPEPGTGTPDGLCVDAEGAVWAALWSGGRVVRWSSSGRLTHEVRLPVSQPTSVALGGDNLQTLFITTSALNVDSGLEPEAGCLFALDVDVPGVPPFPWRPFSPLGKLY